MVYDHAVTLLPAALLLAAARPASAAADDATALLKRTTANVTANDTHIQNYTCVETVSRDYFEPAASTLARSCSWLLEQRQRPTPDMVLRLESTDRLRLDVTTAERGEIFSWAGASHFDDSGVENVVREGPIGSGAFGAFLSVIFGSDAKRFIYEGTTTVDGRRLAQYFFDVVLADSHYMVKLKDGVNRVPTAYSGSVLVDPETADPVRLTLQTAELPEATGSCQTVASLTYGRVKIGDRELLLPTSARQRFISRDGRETENTTSFTGCREYSSESTVNFFQEADARPANGAAAGPAIPKSIPGGLRLTFQLTRPIETDAAAAGDRFTAKLTEPLREGRTVLAPKGVLLEGRITMVKTFHRPKHEVVLGLAPRNIEIKGSKVALAALPDQRAILLEMRRNRQKGLAIFLPPRGDYSGIFRASGTHVVFRSGFVSEWVTMLERRSR